MTKKEYLDELRKELKSKNVKDIEDIIFEYEEHFNFKMEEGFTEEEIVKKLPAPKDIANEYAPKDIPVNKFEKGTKITGLTFLSIPLGMIYILMWASVGVLGLFSLACLVGGFSLITTINIGGIIPYIPYLPALIIGIACFGLSVLSAIGTFYMFMYIKQWGKVYIRWCKNIANNNPYPSISKQPKISKKLSSKLKLISAIGLVCFVTAFIIGYIFMCIASKSFEPWHVWNWFV